MHRGDRPLKRRHLAHVVRWGMAAVAAAMIATSSGSGAPVGAIHTHQVASVSSIAPAVPDDPVLLAPEDLPDFSGWQVGALPAWFGQPATPRLPKSAIPPPTGPVVTALGASGIPEIALRAYVNAARSIAVSNPSCHLDWSVLAAIGRVESNHGRFGGAELRADGSGTRPIRGIPLDGRPGVARILDTDGGVFDGDVAFDRAVGPMQFLPSTWHFVAADGNGDGTMDPNNIFDATLGAARYLCAGGADLSNRAALTTAILRYNHSSDYAALVLALADAYHRGQTTLPPVGPVHPAPPVTTPVLPPVNVGIPPGLHDPGSGDESADPVPPTPTPPVTEPPTTTPPPTDPSCPPTTEPVDGSTADPATDPTTDPAADSATDPTDGTTATPSCPPTDPTTDPPTTEPTDPTTDPTDPTTTDPSTTEPTDPTADPTADPTTDPSTTDPTDPTTDPTDGTTSSETSAAPATPTPTATATAT